MANTSLMCDLDAVGAALRPWKLQRYTSTVVDAWMPLAALMLGTRKLPQVLHSTGRQTR
jgi:hypothetical protein